MIHTLNLEKITRGYLNLVIGCFVLLLTACSDNEPIKLEPPINDGRMLEVDQVVQQLVTLDKEATYGTRAGMYPTGSKEILKKAISLGNKYYLLFKYGPIPEDQSVAAAYQEMDNAKTQFLASRLTEDLQMPAELFVDGLRDGYIDFGSSPEYASFGERGKQRFTVETWIKLTQINGFGAVLTTFHEDGGQNIRQGWMINHFDNRNLRMSYSMSSYHNMLEPGVRVDMPQSANTWVHFATVYSDDGFNGEKDGNGTLIVGKVYKNGVLESTFTKRNSGDVYSASAIKLSMTAFAEIKSNGSLDRRISGYMKDLRIWKSIKDQQEITALMTKAKVVKGDEADLAAAWDFSMTVKDDQQIPDLTGRHTAKLKGAYRWDLIN
ncbi:LamG-like jellyroll fold domain-containing protein [Sphingobacterium sp. SYP-B4668]|uniref:LamG-like jellyroll fold domain-containing protein n=1 Tax=Sphingobacterium sp. SYP-B4668 TaxID=2996035 RepID=UPI0022DE785D|nr:LamG-like jellyroll fold domain-containing protein [Sphingobacterium sp. SYP-B4668]